MPHKKTLPVTPQGGLQDYQDDRLGRPLDTLDADQIMEPASLEDKFHAFSCDEEGVCGKMPIDTLFENTHETIATSPRSDMHERPYRDGEAANPHNPRYGAVNPPNHEGVNNPASIDRKKGLYPQRRY